MALGFMLAVLLLRLSAGHLLAAVLPGTDSDPAAYYAAVAVQEGVLWGLPALVLLPWRSPLLPARKHTLGLGAAMVPLGLVTQALMVAVMARWSAVTGAQQATLMLPQNAVQWLLAVLALAVVPALAEEAFFRGGLLTALLDRLGTWPGLALTTVFFALMHGSLAGFPAHLCISLLCGLAMLASGRVWVSALLHMSYNGAALLLRDLLPEMVPALPFALLLAAAAVAMVAVIRPRRGTGQLLLTDWLLMMAVLVGAAAMYLPELI